MYFTNVLPSRLGDAGCLRIGIGQADLRIQSAAEAVSASAGIGPLKPGSPCETDPLKLSRGRTASDSWVQDWSRWKR